LRAAPILHAADAEILPEDVEQRYLIPAGRHRATVQDELDGQLND
jgi:hypothetical protein